MARVVGRAAAPFGSVLLDLDGCLTDSNAVHARTWSEALSRFGHRVPAARIRPEVGKGGKEMLRSFLSPAEHTFLSSAMGNVQNELFLARFAREVQPIPGAADAVRRLERAGIPVVLASSAKREVIERSLRRLRLERVLTGFTSADDVLQAKPFDDVFSLAIDRFGLARRRPVAIGDTPYDIAAAHQLGVPCFALRSGGFPARTLRCAERVFRDLADVWALGRNLFAP